jgi:hypothetical protein
VSALARVEAHNAKVSANLTQAGKKPNIMFIMGDDIGMWNIGAYHRGLMAGRTLNLDGGTVEIGTGGRAHHPRSVRRGPTGASPAELRAVRPTDPAGTVPGHSKGGAVLELPDGS